ncbi:Methionine aminopeptidase [Dirofilaria immitis]
MKLSNNRSVMPLDVQGCTRATLEESACCNHYRKILTAGRWPWKLETAKECVTTHLPNQLALKMDGA